MGNLILNFVSDWTLDCFFDIMTCDVFFKLMTSSKVFLLSETCSRWLHSIVTQRRGVSRRNIQTACMVQQLHADLRFCKYGFSVVLYNHWDKVEPNINPPPLIATTSNRGSSDANTHDLVYRRPDLF